MSPWRRQGADLAGDVLDVAVEDLAAAAVLVQEAEDLHRSGQGIALAAGEDVAVTALELLEDLEEEAFAAAGGDVEQGKIVREILLEGHFFKLLAQRVGQRVDEAVHPLLGDLGKRASDLIEINHRHFSQTTKDTLL